MNSAEFYKQLDRIRELPSLPAIVLEVNRILQNLETPTDQLAHIIETDQTMVLKILKLVNSSFYGVPSKISNIASAIILLGFNTIRHAVVSVSVINAFSLKNKLKGFNIQDFWRHSLAVALTSKHLADKVDKSLSSECFTAGLLHDIGKLILCEYFPELFEKIWLRTVENAISFHDAEEMESPVGHAEVGAYLAQKWLLPQPLIEGIRHHHDASNLRIAEIIGIADMLANTCNLETADWFVLPENFSYVPAYLLPQLQTLPQWYPKLQGEIESASQQFLESHSK